MGGFGESLCAVGRSRPRGQGAVWATGCDGNAVAAAIELLQEVRGVNAFATRAFDVLRV